MALQKTYQQFLASPNTGLLADNASLHYITTLLSFGSPADIIKHLNSQTRLLEKKEEKFLSVIEGQHALAIETQTTIEFKAGGGSYLPGLDDNFLTDRVVTFPVVSIAESTIFSVGMLPEERLTDLLRRFTLSASMPKERSYKCA